MAIDKHNIPLLKYIKTPLYLLINCLNGTLGLTDPFPKVM